MGACRKARELAAVETNPGAKELSKSRKCATGCLPTRPATWELQSCRFVHLAIRKENPHRPENSIGDVRYVYPYTRSTCWKADSRRGGRAARLLPAEDREVEILQIQPPATRIAWLQSAEHHNCGMTAKEMTPPMKCHG